MSGTVYDESYCWEGSMGMCDYAWADTDVNDAKLVTG